MNGRAVFAMGDPKDTGFYRFVDSLVARWAGPKAVPDRIERNLQVAEKAIKLAKELAAYHGDFNRDVLSQVHSLLELGAGDA